MVSAGFWPLHDGDQLVIVAEEGQVEVGGFTWSGGLRKVWASPWRRPTCRPSWRSQVKVGGFTWSGGLVGAGSLHDGDPLVVVAKEGQVEVGGFTWWGGLRRVWVFPWRRPTCHHSWRGPGQGRGVGGFTWWGGPRRVWVAPWRRPTCRRS